MLNSLLEDPAFRRMVRVLAELAGYDHSISVPELGSIMHPDPKSSLGQDLRNIADLYQVPHVWPSTCGTTALNVLGLTTLANLNETVVVQRDSHVSTYTAMLQMNLKPVYLVPEYSNELGVNLPVTPAQVQAALDQHPDAQVVVFTYPNYFGLAGNIATNTQIVKEHGKRTMIDAAHGAHLAFHPGLPLPAEQTSAAIVTHSTHKTCSALSQGSLILINDGQLLERFYETVNNLGYATTSFSYPILLSISLALVQLQQRGREALDQAISVCNAVREQINRIDGLKSFGPEDLPESVIGFDPMRVTVDVSGVGLTGYEVADRLIKEFRIYPEMETLKNVLFLFTMADDKTAGDQIVKALRVIALEPRRARRQMTWPMPGLPPQLLLPREAFYSRTTRILQVAEAIGLPSAETIAAYPPGSAVIVAGEEVTAEAVEYLRSVRAEGGVLKGANDPDLRTIKVVA